MGEVVKFRRPRRKGRPSLPDEPGTIILFTGIWYCRETHPEPPPKRTRRSPADRPVRTGRGSRMNPRDHTISG